jgi:hypothetical protein
MSEPLYDLWEADDPLVTITVTEPDVLSVRMFGVPYPAPPELTPLTRGSFGALMDHLYLRLGQPFTVEIIETDGTRRTGTIDQPPPTHTQPAQSTDDRPESPRRADAASHASISSLAEGSSGVPEAAWVRPLPEPEPALAGFTPGEPVLLCLCVGENHADPAGMVSATVPSWLAGEVLVVGRSSGRVRTIDTRQQ